MKKIKINGVEYFAIQASDVKNELDIIVLTPYDVSKEKFSFDENNAKAKYATCKGGISQFFHESDTVDSNGKKIYARVSFAKKIAESKGKKADTRKLKEI